MEAACLVRWPLPVFPGSRTFSKSVGMSQTGQEQTYYARSTRIELCAFQKGTEALTTGFASPILPHQ